MLAQQNAMLATLRVWVTDYYHRTDQWSYEAHRRIFDAHTWAKIEHTTMLIEARLANLPLQPTSGAAQTS